MRVSTRSFHHACRKVFEPGQNCEEKLIRAGLPVCSTTSSRPQRTAGSELVLSLWNELGFQWHAGWNGWLPDQSLGS